jgi:NADPH-dependent 2,4-dienoyl-CoA reductase/sulfur reductase-like enzyme
LTALRCAVNAYAALEDEFKITPAEAKKKVLVVGGGPAGMEAARTAAERGHEVVLAEASDSLGGWLAPASRPPFKRDLEYLRRHLTMDVMRTGVQVETGQEVDEAYVKSMKPDAVIVATGSAPITLDVPGADGENVCIATDVLNGQKVEGERVVVVGGGLVGCETAQYLAAQGKRVAVIEMLDQIGADILITTRSAVVQKLKENAVRTDVNTKAVEVTPEGVVVEKNGSKETFAADAVVSAVGLKARSELADKLKGLVDEVHVVGDCVSPRKIRDAIHEGAKAGREV